MKRTPFNTGWEFRPKADRLLERAGRAPAFRSVTLPHDAMVERDRTSQAGGATGFFPGGVYEYRKTFTVPEEYRDKRVILEFEGVYRDAMVYVNGAYAGQHPYGYSIFTIPLDGFLHYGAENEIRVECRTHQDSRWYSGAGIHRPVHLVVGGPVHIALDGVRVATPDVDAERAVVEVAVVVENAGLSTLTADLPVEIRDGGGAVAASDTAPVTVPPGERVTVHRRLYVRGPALWSVESPALYTFNAVRSAHNPMSRAMLDACDRLGMLVMDEAFDMWTVHKSDFDYAAAFPEWWERDVEAMVRKDVNRPSVVLYSIGNEIPEAPTPSGAAWGRRIAEKIRSLDGTRFITNATDAVPMLMGEAIPIARERLAESGGPMTVGAMMTAVDEVLAELGASAPFDEQTAELLSVLDVAGLNYLDTRYEQDRELFPNRVIVGSETHPTRIDVLWGLVRGNPHVIGDFTWTGWDYLGEAGVGRAGYTDEAGDPAQGFAGGFPWLTARAGDIDITGHRRAPSYYREIVFGLRKEPYLAVHRPENHGRTFAAGPWSWPDAVSSWSWDGHEGAPVRVDVYSGADEVELLLNGASLGRAPAGRAHRYRAEFDAVYEPGELVAVAYAGGQEQARSRLVTARGPARLSVTADRAGIRADDTDLAYLAIALTDGEGIVRLGADRPVTVRVTGPGVLQGLGTGRPVTEEPFTGDTCTTYDGRALAVVRPTGPGAITVTVSAPDCETTTATVHAS